MTFYGGIYRDVWLRLCELCLRFLDLLENTPGQQKSANLNLYVSINNSTDRSRDLTVVQEIYDPAHELVTSVADKTVFSPWKKGN